MDPELEWLVREAGAKLGADGLKQFLKDKISKPVGSDVLTVVTDDTMHPVPSDLVVGQRFDHNFQAGWLAIAQHLDWLA